MKLNEREVPLISAYNEFFKEGDKALKEKRFLRAVASFNMAKSVLSEIASKGVKVDNKEREKLEKLLDKANKKLQSEDKKKKARGLKGILSKLKGLIQKEEKKEIKTKTLSIFLFGIDRAGKTTFVDYLKQEKFLDHAPTLGIDVSHIVLGKLKIEFNDLGGQEAFRGNWMDYWRDQDFLIFMVDAADSERFLEANSALWSILDRPETEKKPLLILSNKIDLPESKSFKDIIEALELEKIKNKTIGVFEISIKEDTNLDKALAFISSYALEDEEMKEFVSEEVHRLAKHLREQARSFIADAKAREKEEKFEDALKNIHKAKIIQDELFKNGFMKANKESLKCLDMMSGILKTMNKKGIAASEKWWKEN
ncbi:MAG: ADP-ribosylation factor-like protein [Candidatus Hodarchaeota archaeon]